MTSFTITGTTTSPQTLSSSETGFIGVNGAIVSSAADAVSGTGVNNLAIFGALVNQSFFISRSAYDFNGSSATVLIGATGNVSSQSHAIVGRPTAQMFITNDGVISADETALDIGAGDNAATIQVINNGTISGQAIGMRLMSGSQSTKVINTGVITGLNNAIIADDLVPSATGPSTLVNSGSIIGVQFAYQGRIGVDHITNSGFMSGGISLRAGDDVYDGALGSVSGAVLGDAGNDTLIGGSQGDELHGGLGKDFITGGDGDDTLSGGGGQDTINAGKGDDTVSGGNSDDLIRGGDGADILTGDNGNDVLRGGAGDDEIHGGEGDDDIRGGHGEDIIRGDGGKDLILGKAGNDTIFGGGGQDNLHGQTGDDDLSGQGGGDRLSGGAGDDRLNGGGGDDRLNGGSGNDTFIFADGDGDDVIEDFKATSNAEKIDLGAVTAINNIAQLNGAASQVGADVLIDTGGGNSILLEGVNLGDLGNGDFIF